MVKVEVLKKQRRWALIDAIDRETELLMDNIYSVWSINVGTLDILPTLMYHAFP